jgi:amino acid adenylation domain-containing protein
MHVNEDPLKTGGHEEKGFVHILFRQQCKRTPAAIALRHGKSTITYSELDSRSDMLAAKILERSPGSSITAVSTTRSVEMIVAVLAILKSGKAYLPLDPEYPAERLAQMVHHSQTEICICPEQESDVFSSLGLKTLSAFESSIHNEPGVKDPGELAYILFTSGSTGRPKGVCMGHAAMVNLLHWQKNNSIAGEGTRTLQFAPLHFDVSFQEIFSTLTTGGELILIDDDLRLDPHQLLKFIIAESVHRLFLPFVALQLLAETANTDHLFPSGLQEVITAGEQLKITGSLMRFFKAMPGCRLYNQYGPTETHVVSALNLTGDPDLWPALPSIGKPIDHCAIYILDEAMQLVSDNVPGELCIAGVCLAEGYLNRPDLTEEKFIHWINPENNAVRLYRTGDLARYRTDGNIEFLGRKDDQVKVRGHRVEPGEIEVLLTAQKGIQDVVVMAREDLPGQLYLVAYLVSGNSEKDTIFIRNQLKGVLPDYMIPDAFVWLDAFPKTSSGKIDKKSLPKPDNKRPETGVFYKAPTSATETMLSDIWSGLLHIEKIGIEDNFFELGGNSLLVVKAVSLLKQKHQLQLPVTKMYLYPTIEGVAAFLDGKGTNVSRTKTIKPPGEQEEIAVIGMAGRFPGANTINELWELLRHGKETISFFSSEDLDPAIPDSIKNDRDYVPARGVVNHANRFDAAFFGINEKLADLMDPQQRLFLEISWEALESAGCLPSVYSGSIGVFAGTGNNSYYLNNVLTNPEMVDTMGAFQVMTLNEKDYISSRTAFTMNLKGPAVSVQAACTTSLLAIAQAADSLRKGQCDVALAGGASVTAPLNSGHIFQDGAMLSRDGHCRPFDADASGTVFSDGAGVVVLKTKSAAEHDGDKIWAILKGVGVNNDGGGKGSFTAPSAEGQAGAIMMAMEDANVEPSSISYIETHGTATPLGDPIEIEGLSIAFHGSRDKKQFCALGSIKSNMGHLTAAAGVAGFIKTVLSLHHQQLPPSIHFNRPNPHIAFEQTPFFVNDRLRSWEAKTIRRAGVSSFGVGGTNVHLVLEEYHNPVRVLDKGRPFQLISWSAKTESSLNDYAKKLAGTLEENASASLADIAYTLQTTRTDFNERRFVVASSALGCTDKLISPPLPGTYSDLKEQSRGIAFVFPGQGAQYVNMGLELYRHEKIFRDAVDECAALLEPVMKGDIRDVMYPATTGDVASEKINNTRYAQPALFVIGYALTKCWMNWGVKPSAFVGHSIGEFIAAHFAGVFNLADALMLVATRGSMMSELQFGSMLSVRANHESVQLELPEDISVAAINSPHLTVLSGPTESIDSYSSELLKKEIQHKKLYTSHAFHSSMMDSIVEPFQQVVASVPLHKPDIPIISTVTGKELTDAEATDPSYWATHLRKTVRFSQAVTALLDRGYTCVLDAGPRNTGAMLIHQHAHAKMPKIISSLEAFEGQSDYESILKAVGQLWLNGVNIDWPAFYAGQQRQRTEIPSYSFDKTRHWIEPGMVVTRSAAGVRVNPDPETPFVEGIGSRKDQLSQKIKTILEEVSGIDMRYADNNASFIELGFDSLLLTQVSLLFKKEFQVPVTFRQLNESFSSLELLATYFDSTLPLNAERSTLNAHRSSLIDPPSTVNRQLSTNLSPEELEELKKPFGASARIEKRSSQLTTKQKTYLDLFTIRYNQKTAASKKYTQEHRSYMSDPRVVTGFKPLTKEIAYPIVVNRSKGSRLWDLDGNEYVDVLNGFGSNFLGYQPQKITEAIKKQIDKGYELGPQHELAGPVCKQICSFTGFDRSALCNTGSEAVMGAMRIARTVTGRSLIVAFSGSYHGIMDEVIVRGTKSLKTFPAAPGIMTNAVQNMLILDYGTEESLCIIRERSEELAAVLVEPVQSRRPEFQPIEFLKEVRRITEHSNTALIFDEVITGFRMHPGGAQAMFGIRADIGAYGKVVAGGMPFGVIAGKKLWMDALDGGDWKFGDDSIPESGVTYFAGTFVRHPLALAAASALLEYMKERGPALQDSLNKRTQRMADAMNDICNVNGIPLFVAQFGSLWKLKWKEEIPYGELLFAVLRNKGVYIMDGFPCFLSDAHTDQDVDFVIQQFEDSIRDLIRGGFMIEQQTDTKAVAAMPDRPPVPGARLGRDPQGNPAWFISDPDRPGKYMQMNKK